MLLEKSNKKYVSQLESENEKLADLMSNNLIKIITIMVTINTGCLVLSVPLALEVFSSFSSAPVEKDTADLLQRGFRIIKLSWSFSFSGLFLSMFYLYFASNDIECRFNLNNYLIAKSENILKADFSDDDKLYEKSENSLVRRLHWKNAFLLFAVITTSLSIFSLILFAGSVIRAHLEKI